MPSASALALSMQAEKLSFVELRSMALNTLPHETVRRMMAAFEVWSGFKIQQGFAIYCLRLQFFCFVVDAFGLFFYAYMFLEASACFLEASACF